jgi:hypothetical protein
MSHIKLLVTALPNAGKTTTLQTLQEVLVIARDGKQYPFPQPHVNIPDFTDIDTFIETVVDKINSYEAKFGQLPKIVAFDSMSKILLDIEGYVLEQVKSFPYGKVNTEIKKLVDFIERDLVANFDVIMVSHAIYDEDTTSYKLVNAGGSYGKKGGILSEVDEAVFLEVKGKKRYVHYRNPRMAARTTVKELPDQDDMETFNLQAHVEMLREKKTTAAKWSL